VQVGLPLGQHVAGHGRGAGAGAADAGAAQLQRRVHLGVEGGAADDREQAFLVAARHEDAGGVLDVADIVLAVGVVPGAQVQMHALLDAELAEDPVVDVPHLVRDRAGGRDHDDLGGGAARQLDEAAEDRLVALAVFVAADDHQVAVAVRQLFGFGRLGVCAVRGVHVGHGRPVGVKVEAV
jgi:hypothetical protein